MTAICYDLFGGYSCVCIPGYSGDDCEINIDDCLSEPCLHGTCKDQGPEIYSCICESGYGGDNCNLGMFYFRTYSFLVQ